MLNQYVRHENLSLISSRCQSDLNVFAQADQKKQLNNSVPTLSMISQFQAD